MSLVNMKSIEIIYNELLRDFNSQRDFKTKKYYFTQNVFIGGIFIARIMCLF